VEKMERAGAFAHTFARKVRHVDRREHMSAHGLGHRALQLAGVLGVTCGLLFSWSSDVVARSRSDESSVRQSTCGYGPTRRVGQVRESALREASALVASQQWPGIYWTFNDSGNAPLVYAFDEDGQPRGTFQVTNATNVDWEAMQLGLDENGSYALYIGDVGDNKQRRRESVIYRVPEPEPVAAGEQAIARATAPAMAFKFVYPVAARNVEAMLVHPKTGEIEFISQDVTGFSLVYRHPLPLDSEHTAALDLVGIVDARALGPRDGQVTDATISPDGHHVVVRTSTRALVYDVPDWAPWWRTWSDEPRVYRLDDGPKGEGITYRYGSEDLVSIGEGVSPFLYQTDWLC
jgi:hypothetical protein